MRGIEKRLEHCPTNRSTGSVTLRVNSALGREEIKEAGLVVRKKEGRVLTIPLRQPSLEIPS